MITQWDIVSRIEPIDASICYSLLIDGTEQDARLIAKKLEGYVQYTQRAEAPYVYRFELPADLDDDTLEKIRVAVKEGIEQAKKVNEFVPGGMLGNPLFNASVGQEDRTFPTLITSDPSESLFQSDVSSEKTGPQVEGLERKSIDLDQPEQMTETPIENTEEPSTVQVHTHTVSAEQTPQPDAQAALGALPQEEEKAPSFLAKTQPLDDIFLAETKYDIFVDVNTPSNPKDSQASSATDSASNLPHDESEGGFNIFDQKIKDQTAFLDLSDVASVTKSITEKDLSFLKHTLPASTQEAQPPSSEETQPEDPALQLNTPVPQDTSRSGEVMDPFEQLLAAADSASKNSSATAQPAPQQEAPTSSTAGRNSVLPETDPGTSFSQPLRSFSPQQRPEREDLTLSNPTENKSVANHLPLPPASITEEIMTTENPEHLHTFSIKRKSQPPKAPAPAAPIPPAPPAPAAPKPAAPQPPKPAAPKPQAPSAKAAQAQAPAPQEEVHRTIVRKEIPVSPSLEKTRTIDHSIELPFSELQKHNWPLEVPLIPTYTLENMIISVNRFAHATAISVIENPGKLYNPLVLYGASGTGKTHFLHAIGYALSKKYGQENVFVTNGVRLSRGIQRYIMEGKIDQFMSFAATLKALLIDDIHLISINEQNRAHLSKLLSDFRAQQKQIVITSKYPPENLAKLEELLDFKLDSGWISELKQASGNARLRIIQHMLTGNGINITNNDVDRFFGHANMSLGTVVRSVRRVRVLEKFIFPNLSPEKRSALTIFDQLLATKGEDQTSQIYQKSIGEIQNTTVTGNGEWGRIGFFYPQNHSDMMNWMLFAMQQRAKELGIEGGLELAVRSSYSTENIISSAFKIANLCDNKKLKGAVILGPSLDICEPSVRENFYDILTHMLEIMLIRCGVINMEDASAPSTYVKILAELLR